MIMRIEGWKLKEWNDAYSDSKLPPMKPKEIEEAIKYLRAAKYPKPEDCPGKECVDYRPACTIGICRIAVGMCGDF